jgi:KUP system potassium uptake protein
VAAGSTLFFLVLDALLVAGCAVKFLDGGWFPLAIGAVLFVVMSTWSRGRTKMLESLRQDGVELQPFVDSLDGHRVPRIDRTAVYLVANPDTVPHALLHNLKHYEVLHERNVILHVEFHEVPWIGMAARADVQPLGHAFWRVTLHFGFMNTPDVPKALQLCEQVGLMIPTMKTSYFLSRATVVATRGAGMAKGREKLFAAMSRGSGSAVEFFRLPDNPVVQLGTRVQI